MRETKFQVWDSNKHKMWVVGGIVFNKGKIVEIDSDDGELICYEVPAYVQLREFTGLNDKNGKEIYDRSIVRDGKGRVLEVFWNDLGAGGWWFSEDNEHVKEINLTGLELIGSVFENPELLD